MFKKSFKNSGKIPIIFFVLFDQFWHIACQDWSRNTGELFLLWFIVFSLIFVENLDKKLVKIVCFLLHLFWVIKTCFLWPFACWKLLEKVHVKLWIICVVFHHILWSFLHVLIPISWLMIIGIWWMILECYLLHNT
jgi:hypothetical protein